MIDSKLSWDSHIQCITQKAKTRLHRLQWGLASTWGFRPIIARHMIEATILPILHYAAPAWSSIVRFPSKLIPVNNILRQAALLTMGLFRTTSHEAARFIAGYMPADIYIRQHLVEFYLRHLTYGHDLLEMTPTTSRVNHTQAPIDVLRSELDTLSTHLPLQTLQNVEKRLWWYTDPIFDDTSLSPSFTDRDMALDCIRQARATSTPDHLWIFTDGSLYMMLTHIRIIVAHLQFSSRERTPLANQLLPTSLAIIPAHIRN